MTHRNRGPIRRLLWSGALGVTLVATAVAIPSYGSRDGNLLARYDATKAAVLEARPHVDPPGTAPHDHNDPATKNSLSRAGETGAETQDPTTADEKRASAAYVAAERRLPDPRLTTVAGHRRRGGAPAGPLRDGQRLLHPDPARRAAVLQADEPRHLPALRRRPRRFVSASGGTRRPRPGRTPSGPPGGRARRSPSATATTRPDAAAAPPLPCRPAPTGCTAYPESQIDISGDPHAGVTPYQEVRGYVDAHTHGMAFEFLGGDVHCGKPWDRYGAPYALVDCPDHTATGGYGGLARGRALRASPTTTRSAGRRSRTGRRRTR